MDMPSLYGSHFYKVVDTHVSLGRMVVFEREKRSPGLESAQSRSFAFWSKFLMSALTLQMLGKWGSGSDQCLALLLQTTVLIVDTA